ncbi:cell division protein ZapA [Psychrobacter glacincola]|uniref:cell division protein ZapA n=1 Tax=Psychrobacter glacincola TaxID=56810 RepID=UPI003FD440BC
MTDDHKNSIEKQPQTSQQQNIGSKSQPVAATGSNTPSATVKTTIPEPQIKKVDIVIAGVTYPIYCPVHEQEELRSAVSYINNYALDLKRDAPSLSQESILVLCCLNLYEKIHTNQRNDEDRLQQDKQSEALLNKIMKDAQSVL